MSRVKKQNKTKPQKKKKKKTHTNKQTNNNKKKKHKTKQKTTTSKQTKNKQQRQLIRVFHVPARSNLLFLNFTIKNLVGLNEQSFVFTLYLIFKFAEKVFEGSFDRDTNIIHVFYQPVLAHYVRIRPEKWYGHISLRFELLGCPGK